MKKDKKKSYYLQIFKQLLFYIMKPLGHLFSASLKNIQVFL